MAMSEAEQNIAASDAPNDHFRAVSELVRTPGVDPVDALRLFMIFALRYEKSKPDRVAELRRLLTETPLMSESINLVDALLAYGGAGVRGGDLFGTAAGLVAKLQSHVTRNMRGVENVYTQHEPVMVGLLDQIARGKLSKQAFPYVGNEPPGPRFSTVIVFVVGGVTYEEATKVAAINSGALQLGGAAAGGAASPTVPGGAASAPPFRVILGGTAVLNSEQFLAELMRLHTGHVAVDVAGSGNAGGAGTGLASY